MNNKDRIRIEIRTTLDRKEFIFQFAKDNNTTVSKLLNDLIDLLIEENSTK